MMSGRPLFLIVDDVNPSDQAAQLRKALQIVNLGGDVDFAASPAEMLERLRKRIPAVILLDHHWPEMAIGKILDELRRTAPGG